MFVFLKLNMLDSAFCKVVVKQFDYCLYLQLKVRVDIVHISQYQYSAQQEKEKSEAVID